jgi:hypothetical protein
MITTGRILLMLKHLQIIALMVYYIIGKLRNACPEGWHLPTDAEWTELIEFLGGEEVAGGKLKETGTTHWISPNTDASNETGFTALPAVIVTTTAILSILDTTRIGGVQLRSMVIMPGTHIYTIIIALLADIPVARKWVILSVALKINAIVNLCLILVF